MSLMVMSNSSDPQKGQGFNGLFILLLLTYLVMYTPDEVYPTRILKKIVEVEFDIWTIFTFTRECKFNHCFTS